MQTAAPLFRRDSDRVGRCALALIGILSLLLAFLPSPTPARAAPARQVTQLSVTGMTSGSEFGSAIAMSADTLEHSSEKLNRDILGRCELILSICANGH